MSTSTDVAVRDEYAPEAQHTGALAISADQVQWTTMQEAALNQLGLKNAPDGDRLVFLHVAQRTGLDPFAKQIHMLERGGKWSIQTGIDGFRVNRARAERLAGVRGVLGQAVFIDAEGNEYKRWFKPGPPVGCEITYTVRDENGDTPYTSYLRFTEYAQYKMDGKLNAKWSSSPAHMLEKCTEADVYRKAFPQDFSGISFEDAAAPDGSDGAPAEPVKQRQRVTADAIRARSTVTATVVTPDVPSAQAESPSADPATAADAGGTRPYEELLTYISKRLAELGVEDAADKLRAVCLIGGVQIKSARGLKQEEALKVADTLEGIKRVGPYGLLADLEQRGDGGSDGE